MSETPGAPLRIDRVLVERSLARSRGHAKDLITAGAVQLDNTVVTRPSTIVAAHAHVVVTHPGPVWVGRGGNKLAAALDMWMPQGVQISGARCIDVGASTGGFTQVLLHHGAMQVVAIDVGTGQLAPALASDPRIRDRSGHHVLSMDLAAVGGPADLIVVDLSFISVRTVLAHIAAWVAASGELIVLVKPQFEVGRSGINSKGIVTAPSLRAQALQDVTTAAYSAGLAAVGAMVCPITGTHGNSEYLMRLAPAQAWMMDRAQAHDLVNTLI